MIDLFMSPLTSFAGGVVYILPFLVVFFAVVLFHEFGHFWVARRAGVGVDVFSIGMGPELAALTDSKGTRWRVGALPLGGYVRFRGEEDPEGEGSYLASTVWQRMAIVVAGPAANFLLAILIYAGLFMTIGVVRVQPQVAAVMAGTAAEEAGFAAGDVILAIDGRAVQNYSDLQRAAGMGIGRELAITVDRGGVEAILYAVPREGEVPDGFGGTHRGGLLGVELDPSAPIAYQRLSPPVALWTGIEQTARLTAGIASYLGQLVTGRAGADALGGPLRIADISAKTAAFGVVALLALIAALSVSLGFINLVPFPLLDGGHLLFYIIEAVRGEPLSERLQAIAMRIGVAGLVTLFAFIIFNDLVQLGFLGGDEDS